MPHDGVRLYTYSTRSRFYHNPTTGQVWMLKEALRGGPIPVKSLASLPSPAHLMAFCSPPTILNHTPSTYPYSHILWISSLFIRHLVFFAHWHGTVRLDERV